MRIMLLGPVTVAVGGHRYKLRRSQTRGLLALLALNVGEPLSVEAAIEALWGGRAPQTARARVQDYISAIRRELRAWGAPDCIERGRYGYVLRLVPDAVDALEMAAGLREARGLTDSGKAIARYREALALWAGAPLADASGSYVEGVRTRLVDQRLGGIEAVSELELARGEHTAVATELSPLVASHPMRERLAGTLMLALYRGGDRAAALGLYRRCRTELANALGLEPGGDLQRLHRAILIGDPALDPKTEASAETRLVRPAQLPSAPAVFIGRDRLLARLGAAALPGRIAVLTGRGGVGKTALALAWAHAAVAEFPDGQLYANLHGFSSGRPVTAVAVASGFLRALGVPGREIPSGADEAMACLRSELAGRRVLMLLDNAGSAAQIRPLLPGESSITVLVTSRDRLSGLAATHDAQQIDLDGLPQAEAASLLRLLLPERKLSPEESTDLARLCGCLPLALRVAAARLRDDPGLDAADYARALASGTRLKELAIEGDTDATIRATFGLSYARLDKAQRRVFRLLGLLPAGDFDAAVAARLAATTPARASQRLAGLVAAHLVDVTDAGRYAMHDLLRAYAAESVAAEESAEAIREARDRVFGWLLTMARAASAMIAPEVPMLPGIAASPAWTTAAEALAWMESELHQLAAAVATAEAAGLPAYAWRLPDAARTFFWHTGRQAHWLAAAQQAVTVAGRAGDPAANAAAHLNLAWHHFVHGRDHDAHEHYGIAARHAEEAGWVEGRISALNNLARTERDLGRPSAALANLRTALTLERELGRGQAVESVIRGLIASICVPAGFLTEALHHAQIAVAASISAIGKAAHLVILAEVHEARGEIDPAADRFTDALRFYEERGLRAGEAKCHTGLGSVAIEKRDYAGAATHLDRAMKLAREAGDAAAEAAALHLLGRLSLGTARASDALAQLDRAQELATAPALRITVLIERGRALAALGRHAEAADVTREAEHEAIRSEYSALADRARGVVSA
jgi:DNA-binding SARP family transcriptional activator/tetratricopeptide (TPR) repeat protein